MIVCFGDHTFPEYYIYVHTEMRRIWCDVFGQMFRRPGLLVYDEADLKLLGCQQLQKIDIFCHMSYGLRQYNCLISYLFSGVLLQLQPYPRV